MANHNFKKLHVWTHAKDLAKSVYVLTKKLPDDEKFGLVSQMRRCAVSIPSNIAEGSKRSTKKDFNQFICIAQGSSAELETQLILAAELFDLNTDAIQTQLQSVQNMLFKLSVSLKS